MSYDKHNLYWGAYKPQKDFVGIKKADWIVERFLGEDDAGGNFSNNPNDKGTICLILEDKENSFWPVMSFLSNEEIRKLIKDLTEFIK